MKTQANLLCKKEKYFNRELNEWFCPHCYHKFIEINQILKYREEIFHNVLSNFNKTIINFIKQKRKLQFLLLKKI